MRFLHDSASLEAIDAWHFGMKRDAQGVTALVILIQAYEGANGRIGKLGSQFFCRIAQGPVIAGGISGGKEKLGIRAGRFRTRVHRIY